MLCQTDGAGCGSIDLSVLCSRVLSLTGINCHLFQVVSLPVILTSQTSQEIMAKGTLIWDAAFSEQVICSLLSC